MDTQIGKTTIQLASQQGQINYTSSTEPMGIIALVMRDTIEEKSLIQHNVKDAQPRLKHYSFYKSKNHEKNQDITITWHDNQAADISASYKHKTHQLNHLGPLWDRNSMQLGLMSALKSDFSITRLNYNVVDKGSINEYQYRHIADESRSIDKIKYDTVKFSLKRPDSDRVTYLWLAPELDYLPVYIEQYKGKELNLSMQLVNYKNTTL